MKKAKTAKPNAKAAEPAVDQPSRRTERLMALWHYENDGRGCSIHEFLPDLFELATEALNSISPDEDGPTAEEMARSTRDAQLIADHILLALVEGGHYERALAYVERIAEQRRECDARSGAPREIPFDRDEWYRLLKKVGRMDEFGCVRTGAVKP